MTAFAFKLYLTRFIASYLFFCVAACLLLIIYSGTTIPEHLSMLLAAAVQVFLFIWLFVSWMEHHYFD